MRSAIRQSIACIGLLPLVLAAPANGYDPDAPCCRGSGGPPRWYVGISGSAVYLERTSINSSSATYLDANQSYNRGYGLSASAGYQLLSGVRAELEIAERENRVKKDLYVTGVIPTGSYTAQTSTAFMANGYLDLHNGTKFTPYFGGGVGLALVKNPDFYIDPATHGSTGKIMSWVPAYQFMAGVSYHIDTHIAPFEVNMGYRYFTTGDVKNDYKGANPSNFTSNNTTQNFELGGRVYF